MEYKVIPVPPANWMERLRRGHWVWLVKESEPAQVEFPYEPPEPGKLVGKIGIRRFDQGENRYRDIQSWYIDTNGNGLDHSILMLPIEDNLPDDPEPLPVPVARQLQRSIEHLEERVGSLERFYDELPDTPPQEWSTLYNQLPAWRLARVWVCAKVAMLKTWWQNIARTS